MANPLSVYGRFTTHDAPWKLSTRGYWRFFNNLTRRNKNVNEYIVATKPSTSIASANIKALRLYRHLCRVAPFTLKINEIDHQTTAIRTFNHIGNYFRYNANEYYLHMIDRKIEGGYEILNELEWKYADPYTHARYFMAPYKTWRSIGKNRFNYYRTNRLNRKSTSPFLKKFYHGSKSHYF